MEEVDPLRAVSVATARNRVKQDSREGYNSKIKYCIKFMKATFPSVQSEVEVVDGDERLKLPLMKQYQQCLRK